MEGLKVSGWGESWSKDQKLLLSTAFFLFVETSLTLAPPPTTFVFCLPFLPSEEVRCCLLLPADTEDRARLPQGTLFGAG